MEEDIKLLRLIVLLLQKPRTVREISEALEVTRWRAHWLVNRLKAILPQVPGIPQLKSQICSRARAYFLDVPAMSWAPIHEISTNEK